MGFISLIIRPAISWSIVIPGLWHAVLDVHPRNVRCNTWIQEMIFSWNHFHTIHEWWYIYLHDWLNVGKYTIHGCYGIGIWSKNVVEKKSR